MQEPRLWKDRRSERRPKPSLATAIIAMVIGWVVLLIYDIILADTWHTAPEGYGHFRLILPLLGLAPMAIRLLSPGELTDDQEAYKTFVRLTVANLVVCAILAIFSIVPFAYTDAGIAEDFWSLLVGRLLGLAVMVSMMMFADDLIRLYHYRQRAAVPKAVKLYPYLLILLLVLEEGMVIVEPANDSIIRYAAGGLAGLGFLLSIRSSWLINLRKRQKLSLLGLSFVGFPASVAILTMMEDKQLALMSLAPMMLPLTFTVGLSVLFAHMVIFVSALLALPTADAIDRRNDEVSSLANFARLLTQSLDTEDLVETAIALTCDATAANASWIEVADGENSGIGNCQVHYGKEPKLPPGVAEHLMSRPLPDGTPLAAEVRSSRRTEVIERVSDAVWSPPGGPAKELRSVAAIPLLLGEKFLGTLYAAKERADGFDREEIVVLNALANQIAVALDHSRLIRTSIERERFEQEMLIARDLQQRLLPKVMPESPRYEIHAESSPASMVGGDYYDVISFIDCTIGLLIADVSGKGASAALYMGMIKGIVQAFSGRCNSPKELLTQANVALHGNIDQRWFATMTCAQIVEETRTLRITRAGHCPTLLVRGGVGSYSRPNGLGLAIAGPALFDRNLCIEEVEFQPGDYAVFFSDGLPEAQSSDGREFGYEALMDVVVRAAGAGASPLQMRDAIFGAIEEFAQGEPTADDSTLIVFRWR